MFIFIKKTPKQTQTDYSLPYLIQTHVHRHVQTQKPILHFFQAQIILEAYLIDLGVK